MISEPVNCDPRPRRKLPREFYRGEDTIAISRWLLGKYLISETQPGQRTGGRIVETEAYCGAIDKACHAYRNRCTTRNAVMFEEGGLSYVYLCYGIHYMFNIVTHGRGYPHAILVRAIEASEGLEVICKRRGQKNLGRDICRGPGRLTQALGIRREHNALDLTGEVVWLEEDPSEPAPEDVQILASPRVGIPYAEEYTAMPWRFRLCTAGDPV